MEKVLLYFHDEKTIDAAISFFRNENIAFTIVNDTHLEDTIKNLLETNFENCLFVEKNNLSSCSLGIAGLSKYKKGIETSLMPLYLRKSQAERALEEKN